MNSQAKIRSILFFIIPFSIIACSGGSSSKNDDEFSSRQEFNVSGTNSNTILNEAKEYDLDISGTRNTVHVLKNNKINILNISGVSNVILIDQNTTINALNVSGTSNNIFAPFDSGITFNTDSGVNNKLILTSTNSIEGKWVYTYPATQCEETYIFSSDNTFSATSLDEAFGGIFSFEETVVNGEKHDLSITITSDTSQSDCNGSTTSNTGDTFNILVEFINPSTMKWIFDDPTEESAIILSKE